MTHQTFIIFILTTLEDIYHGVTLPISAPPFGFRCIDNDGSLSSALSNNPALDDGAFNDNGVLLVTDIGAVAVWVVDAVVCAPMLLLALV